MLNKPSFETLTCATQIPRINTNFSPTGGDPDLTLCKETSCRFIKQQPDPPRLDAEEVPTWGFGYCFIKEAGGVPQCGSSSGTGEISKGKVNLEVKSWSFSIRPQPHKEFSFSAITFEDGVLFFTLSLQKALSSILWDSKAFISP